MRIQPTTEQEQSERTGVTAASPMTSNATTASSNDGSSVANDAVSPQRTLSPLDERAFDTLFREARTHYAWLPYPIEDELLEEIYELAKWGPTAMNSSPLRVLYLKSDEAKARLLPTLSEGNIEKSRTASAVAILAYDTEFYEKMTKLVPHRDVRGMFQSNAVLAEQIASMNGNLQAGYFIMAARSLGVDCGPMGGFDREKLNAEFFADGKWKSFLVVNLGYGDPAKTMPRAPRLDFSEAATIL